ncbi:MAG: VOC family protein [Pseudomonadota bacterium]
MRLIRAGTLAVASLKRAVENYRRWLDYELVEEGTVDAALAASLGAPATAGAPLAVMRPASGAGIYLRFVEQPPHPEYVPLRSYGWAAIELCVTDVLAANERVLDAPDFEIIGPPREIDGLPAIYPMQMQGPDGEIVYLTQIRDDLPAFDLPRAQSLIDHLFILVMACSDLPASLKWMERYTGMNIGRESMEIVYTMLANAFDLPHEQLHTIATMVHGRDVFLELDQYPPAAVARPRHDGWLPPGVAVGTFWHPDFAKLAANAGDVAIGAPQTHASAIYAGQPSLTIVDPDGTLIELVGG